MLAALSAWITWMWGPFACRRCGAGWTCRWPPRPPTLDIRFIFSLHLSLGAVHISLKLYFYVYLDGETSLIRVKTQSCIKTLEIKRKTRRFGRWHLLLQSMILGKEVTEKSFVNSGSSIMFTFNILLYPYLWIKIPWLNVWKSLTLTTLRGMFFVAACNLSSCGLKLTQAGHLR